jgi:hypothetical protein
MPLLHVLGKEGAIGRPVVTELTLEALDALDGLGMVVYGFTHEDSCTARASAAARRALSAGMVGLGTRGA